MLQRVEEYAWSLKSASTNGPWPTAREGTSCVGRGDSSTHCEDTAASVESILVPAHVGGFRHCPNQAFAHQVVERSCTVLFGRPDLAIRVAWSIGCSALIRW